MKTPASVSPSRKKERLNMSTKQEHMEYWDLMNRLNKTMYYGTRPKTERPSLALTDIAVNKFTLYDHLFPSLENLHMEKASSLSREACISPCSLVLAMVYIDRLGRSNPNFLASVPSSKLFIVSVMVASKFLQDEGEEDEVFNDEWANSVNMELAELNKLEREFLQTIDWRLLVDQEEFAETLTQIEKQIAIKESSKRGWFSYTDLDILAESRLISATLDVLTSQVLTVAIACTAAYVASLLTLVGSAAIVARLPWNQKPTELATVSNFSVNNPDLPILAFPNSTQVEVDQETMLDEDLEILNETNRVFTLDFPGFYRENTKRDYGFYDFASFVPKHRFNYDTHSLERMENLPGKMEILCRNLKIPNCAVAA
nr:EOG090X069C [Eulimnadia texana]